ncbi:MAG: hypothetical protein R3290_05060 [Acidimicrobiia bacterium]|nr:hypothetical protein [Acidimicrobiia bacterium]
MVDWREQHRRELIEKQRHISQKLAQLREFRALVLSWETRLRRSKQWLDSLDDAVISDSYFNVGALIRLTSITESLQRMVNEFQQVGDPKATGTGTAVQPATGAAPGTSTPVASAEGSGPSTGDYAAWLTSRAGPLATSTPWELVFEFDPVTAESVRQKDWGAAITNVVFNPFTSTAAMGYAEKASNIVSAMREDHADAFDDLKDGWHDTRSALGRIVDALDGVDHQKLRALEAELAEVLRDYERTYDGAPGEDPRAARELRELAEGDGAEEEFEKLAERARARAAELDRASDEPYDPDTDPDLGDLDDLPGLDD